MTLGGMESRLGRTGEALASYLSRLEAGGATSMVSNVAVEVRAFQGAGFVLPIVTPDLGKGNCYVCSFRSHFCDYARYEIDVRRLGVLGRILKGCLLGLAGLMRVARSEQVVFVNNWLLSTNLYPNGVENQVLEIRDDVLREEPGRAIVFRSLNSKSNEALVAALRRAGYRSICSREIYLLDTSAGLHRRRSNFRKDVKLLEGAGFEIVSNDDFSREDLERARELYGKLYLEKYTVLNPQFTQQLFQDGRDCGFLKFLGLRSEEGLVGVVAYYRCGDWITAPILGYETELPQSLGLYRMLTALLTLEGEKLGCRVHRSSGAAQFKISRGAVRELEYSYVYVEHLPWWRRFAWKLFLGIVNRVCAFSLRRIDV